jgi:hypothetical protein
LVHAQTTTISQQAGTTSISNLSYPAEVVLSDSSVVVDVSFTVSYTNWPTDYALQISIANLIPTNEYPSGHIVSSSPLTCQEFASMPESTTCGVFSTTQTSGSEFVEFALTLPSAGTYTTLAATALFYNQGQILSGSYSMKYLTITVTSPNSSPSTSLQSSGTVSGTVSISNFQYPTTVLLGQQATVSFTVSFSGFTPGVTYLIVGVQNADGSSWASGSVVSSSPDNCPEPTEQDLGLAVCFYQPVGSQGSENLAFSLTVTSTGTFSSSGVEAEPALRSSSCSSDWCFGQSQYTSSFAIQAVTSLPPSSSSNSDNSVLIGIVTVGVIAVVASILVYNKRRSRQRAAEAQTMGHEERVAAKIEEPKPQPLQTGIPSTAITPSTPPLSKSNMYCSQCGAVISRDSKFCKACGSKQE